MTTAELEPLAPTLSARELLGLLSARLIHSLSNHLMVLSGNLCVATNSERTPDQSNAALEGALRAANELGALLDQFAACRRGLKDDLGRASADQVFATLESWVRRNEGWIVEIDPECRTFNGSSIPLSAPMLEFVLDSITREIGASEGVVKLSRAIAKQFAWPSPLPQGRAGSVQVSLTYHAAEPLDWEIVKIQLTSVNLAAACEILAQVRAKPESASIASGLQRTTFTLALE